MAARPFNDRGRGSFRTEAERGRAAPRSRLMRKRRSGSPARNHKTAKAKTASMHAHVANGVAGNGGWFTEFAHAIARWAGKPATFLIALGCIAVWGISGPLFGFSDTWQLVVNTATTIVTFLMVFLIQNTQNRDTMALQIKLADLIMAVRGTHNDMAVAEELCDDDLEALHAEYRKRAEHAANSLKERRTRRTA
jgi:low affinity Fe/Cu permease